MELGRIICGLYFTFVTGATGATLGAVLGILLGTMLRQMRTVPTLLPRRPLWHSAAYGAMFGSLIVSLWMTTSIWVWLRNTGTWS